MKKHLITTLLATVPLLFSCNSSDCKVEGTVDNAKDGDTLFIARLTDNQLVPSDTIIIKDGKFEITEKNCDSTIICAYYCEQDSEVYNSFFFLEKGRVKLHIGTESKVSGTENNDIYQSFVDSVYVIHEKMNALYEKAMQNAEANADMFEGNKELSELDKQATALIRRTISNNIQRPVGYFILLSCYNMYSPDELIKVTDQMPDMYKNQPFVKQLREEAEQSKTTANGQPFINMSLPSINGGEIDLASIIKKNKLTLIDCWASWCGPCCNEMPNVVKLYQKYKSQGLEIIGVSFDEDATKWKNAVKEMNMTWPQVSELNSWDNELAKTYNVSSIPYTILISQDGIIVAQQLRGEELDRFVASYLSEN